MRHFGLVPVLIAFAPLSAAADTPDRRCRDDRGVERCDPEAQARMRALYEVPTIEAYREAGDQVRRVFYVNGYGYDMVALSFVRPRGGDPELRVHFPHQSGERNVPPLIAPVPPDEWHALIDRSKLFDRELVSPPPPSGDIMEFCMHGWVFIVEAVDPARGVSRDPSVRRRTENACVDGLTEAYAVEMYEAALRVMPICARLGLSRNVHPVSRLSNCRHLEGDRLSAAAVMNVLDPLFDLPEAGLEEVAAVFDYQATVDWNGDRTASGMQGPEVARFFLSKWSVSGQPSFYVDRIVGERLNLVRFHGGFLRTLRSPGDSTDRYERALVEFVLEGEGEDFTIRNARIEAFHPFTFP